MALAGASGVGWPTVLALVGAAATFRVVPVFAEARPILSCESSRPPCEGKALGSACECTYGPNGCACLDTLCFVEFVEGEDAGDAGDAGDASDAGAAFGVPPRSGPACMPIIACASPAVADCAGKGEGAPCGTWKTCQRWTCLERIGDVYSSENKPTLVCASGQAGGAATGDASTMPAATPTGDVTSTPGGGCSVAMGAPETAMVIVHGALGMLWLVRRARRRVRREGSDGTSC